MAIAQPTLNYRQLVNLLLALILALAVYSCEQSNDYSDHGDLADRVEEAMRGR